MSLEQLVMDSFIQQYGEPPALIVRAPGRVNLIGEHTDYNDGFVMPLAIDRAIWIALRPREDGITHIDSLDFEEPIHFDLANFERDQTSPAEYAKGVAWALQGAGYNLRGFEGVMKGNVPIGAGLSSSAGLELAIARAYAALSDITWDAKAIALLAQKAENEWVGMNSGIMDQLISAAGEAGYALLIDCRSLDIELIPLPEDVAVIVLDTGTRRELVTSEYNVRRQQCEAAAAHFGVDALRDVTPALIQEKKAGLDPLTLRRARHVITENERVLQAKIAMQEGDMVLLGKLLAASHISLRDDFEVSSAALNAIVEAAQSHPACYGARMTGGGFAGCGVAIVQAAQAEEFVAHVTAAYTSTTEHTPAIYVTRPMQGAEIVVDNRG